jgi:hypothetical protein
MKATFPYSVYEAAASAATREHVDLLLSLLAGMAASIESNGILSMSCDVQDLLSTLPDRHAPNAWVCPSQAAMPTSRCSSMHAVTAPWFRTDCAMKDRADALPSAASVRAVRAVSA